MDKKKNPQKKTEKESTKNENKLANIIGSTMKEDLSEGEPRVARISLEETYGTSDQGLWTAIRNRTNAVGFMQYKQIIDDLFCVSDEKMSEPEKARLDKFKDKFQEFKTFDTRLNLKTTDAYKALRLATEVFLLLECGIVDIEGNKKTLKDPYLSGFIRKNSSDKPSYGVSPEETRRYAQSGDVDFDMVQGLLTRYFGGKEQLPYIDNILSIIFANQKTVGQKEQHDCIDVLQHRYTCPSMIELIWSYWHEEGLLTQTMNAIGLRFQNRRGPGRDPLAHLEISPLRPLNNLLWGHIQNEQNRLTLPRRAYEYDHHYGITLYGEAVPKLRSADSRSKFLKGFHDLLLLATQFYRQDADINIKADGFPLLNALKEVHLVLAEGAHNQFGDLPWTARVEMLMEQWLLSRSEFHEFLPRRQMVPYQEDWMGTVDAMKKLQGWGDVSVTHYHTLASVGEKLLLTLRYGNWSDENTITEDNAKNWAKYWKNEVQRYIHAYRVVTGVDLTREPVDANPPWVHLKRQEEKRLAKA